MLRTLLKTNFNNISAIPKGILQNSTSISSIIIPKVDCSIYTEKPFQKMSDKSERTHWLEYNDKVFPPQKPNEEKRPAYVCHELKKVKYSPKKMWIAACFVRGMSVDEALKQLSCARQKGALIVTRAINEAIDIALKEHDVEYRSNLWIAESFATKSLMIKGIRRCAKRRITTIRYRYCNYHIRLEEGQPPADYYNREHLWTGEAMFDRWMNRMHNRKIVNSF